MSGDTFQSLASIEVPAPDIRAFHHGLFTITPLNGKLNVTDLFLIIGIFALYSTLGKALNITFFADSSDFLS